MGKTAFVFPGQGAQYVGMAQKFYDEYQESREIFERASLLSELPIKDICFIENEDIHQTRFTQPVLLTAECAILAAVLAEGIRQDMTAGLSLGEYSALVAAGALDFDEAIKIVCRRGVYMEEAVPAGQGSMMAVISRKGLSQPIEEICESVDGTVIVANYNCPGQQVISGETAAVEAAAEKLTEAGAQRVVQLKVSGPFHSPMLKGAGEKLGEFVADKKISNPEIPFISNVTAAEEQDAETIRALMAKQVCSSVRWQQSMEYMISQGVDTFVEIGPGKTLKGFISKIDRSLKVYNVETPEDLKAMAEELGR